MDPSVDYMTYDESEGIVGNGGGEITLNDPVSSLSGAVVNIPQGALDSEQKIRISIDNSVIPNSSLTSDIIKFEPSGLVFNKPVTIRLPVDNKVAGSSRLFYFQPDSGIVRQIPLTFSGGDFLEAEIAHFSRYFVTEKEYAFFDATLYNTDNTIKARIKFGGTYGLSSIPITKFNSIKSFFLANSLITNAKQVIDECTFYYDLGTREAPEACYATIRVDLKEGNWLYSRKLKSIKLAVQRKGKDLSKPTWAEIKMVEPESRILFTTTPLDSEERELFFSGQALMFDFGIKAENNKKYFLEISWCLSDNSHAYLDGIRYTSVYEVNSYDDYPAWTTENMSRFDPDVNGDFIHDAVAESVNGPNANFTAEQRTVTAGGSVQFTDQSANNPTVWSWNFGDGHTSSLPSPAHTYSTAGVYTVILTVSNSFGSDGETKTGYITVNPAGSAPVANFTGDPRTITAGGSVQFTDQSTNNPTIWSWNFGDGHTSNLPSPAHTYAVAGTYTVTLTVSNSFGSDGETKAGYITVNPAGSAPVANFIGEPRTITAGGLVQFTDQSTNNPTSWSWNFGDGHASSLPSTAHTYNTAGTYTVTLTASNSFGSDGETKIGYIIVNPAGSAPVANFIGEPRTITAGGSVQFTDQSTNNPTSWSWNFGDGNTSNLPSPTHSYAAAGTYTVTLTATNSFGSDGEEKVGYIIVNSPSSSGIIFNPNLTYGEVADIDGNVYKTIEIGTQTWMAENLKTTRYNDGTTIPIVTDNTEWTYLTSPGYCWYNNDPTTYKNTYGALYNWHTVNTDKLCPAGWHVPSDSEWSEMENYLIANGYNYDGATIGNKIAKSLAATTIWASSANTGAVGNTDYSAKRNATGFTGLPGGFRYYYGPFDHINFVTYWWSATEIDNLTAYPRQIGYSWDGIYRHINMPKTFGFSVRCIKN